MLDAWILVTHVGPVGGLVKAAREVSGTVTAVVVGPRALADDVAAAGVDLVRLLTPDDDLPPEALAGQVAEEVAASSPRLVLSLADPSSRVILAAVAARLDAAMVEPVTSLSMDGDALVVTRAAIEGKVVETLGVIGALAGVFDGEDAEVPAGPGAPVTIVPVSADPTGSRIVGTAAEAGGAAGILQAERVVGAGLGVRAKADLALLEELADAAGAEIACSLPIAEDMRWLDASRVVGTSTNSIAPDLYIAVGISGQPQHMSGVRGAKVVVAINNDPDAAIFGKCDYGVVGDLYQIVPALTAVLRRG